MKNDSAVRFETESRAHIGLAVTDLDQSIRFYAILLGQEPTKMRPGYAKFETAEPPLNLALNATSGPTGPNNPVAHFGIQVKSTAAVKCIVERLAAAEVPSRVEEGVTCCYAVQNKVWATDPDGNQWEVFVVLDNNGAQHASSSDACCDAPGCCTNEAPPAVPHSTTACCR
jgi:catechol 2,3-dioxygenase-like lactoylglutathione lyase family enzyme